MSKFLEKHPKLAITFEGAKRGLKLNGLLGYGAGTGIATAVVAASGLATGVVL